MPENDYQTLRRPVHQFEKEPFPGCRNAVVEYFGKYAGRLEILRSKPRELSNPPDVVFTFPGLEDPRIPTTFGEFSIGHYKLLHEMYSGKLLDRFSVGDMQCLQRLLTCEMQYLRGCDLQWLP
jgi:hypothetical protein